METAALALPEPLPDDPEVVATALETAGIFGVQGDLREAVRWVRRAAELAGDAGIDDRAFALARAAADLTSNYSPRPESSAPPQAAPAAAAAAPGVASAPPPPPPPPAVGSQNRPSTPPRESRPPSQAVSVSPIVSLGVRSPQVAADEEGEVTSQHPPHRSRPPEAPSARGLAQRTSDPALTSNGGDTLAALFAERLAVAAAAPVAAGMQAPAVTAPTSAAMGAPPPVLPRPGAAAARRPEFLQTLAYQSPAAPAVARNSDPEPEEPVTPVPAPEATVRYPATESGPASFGAAVADAYAPPPSQVYEPVPPEPAFVEEPVPVLEASVDNPSTEQAPSTVQQSSSRQAARASVEQSQEEGVYILRLLKDGEVAAYGAYEAMVVLVDPDADLFTGV